jgi:hypothetical protein
MIDFYPHHNPLPERARRLNEKHPQRNSNHCAGTCTSMVLKVPPKEFESLFWHLHLDGVERS